jgi:fluoroquinolone transport system permease protein
MKTGRLLRIDALRTTRDPMLSGLALLSPALAVALRFGAERAAHAGYDAAGTIGLVVLLLTIPLMLGFLAALMLLDERDEGVLTAVSLTPAGKTGFLLFRVAAPAVWSALLTLVAIPLAGVLLPAPPRLLALAVLCGMQAALMPAFLGAFAGNKVEGMALSKVATVILMLGALGVLLPDTLQWLAWPSPHYWLARLVLVPAGAPWLGVFGMALLVHAVVLRGMMAVLWRRVG